MSQGPLCPNLSQKVQKEVCQMANRNLSCMILLGGLSVNLNHLKIKNAHWCNRGKTANGYDLWIIAQCLEQMLTVEQEIKRNGKKIALFGTVTDSMLYIILELDTDGIFT